jgi:hypothetical protein
VRKTDGAGFVFPPLMACVASYVCIVPCSELGVVFHRQKIATRVRLNFFPTFGVKTCICTMYPRVSGKRERSIYPCILVEPAELLELTLSLFPKGCNNKKKSAYINLTLPFMWRDDEQHYCCCLGKRTCVKSCSVHSAPYKDCSMGLAGSFSSRYCKYSSWTLSCGSSKASQTSP